MLGNPPYNNASRRRHNHSPLILVSAVLLLTLVASLACGWLMVQTVASYYASRMYPNVHVLGMKLGRMTREEATALLNDVAHHADADHLVDANVGHLVLRDGQNSWSMAWSDAGMQLDVKATVQAAFAVGHAEDRRWQDRMWEWLQRQDVPPVFTVDPALAQQALARLVPTVTILPTDATLRLPDRAEEPVVALPGRSGRELDIEATLARLLAIADGQNSYVDLVFQAVPPRIQDVAALQARVEEMLDRRIELQTYDVLTDETFTRELGRGDILFWLHLVSTSDGQAVVIDREAIKDTLSNLTAELGAGRGFRWAEAAEQAATVFDAGGGAVTLYLTHPERTYIVQSGDSLSRIGAAFGMTSWHVMRANPDIDPDWLYVGQTLTIPSQDELTPLLPVANKRIVVSTAEQRLRAYENGQLVYDWPISTGIAESPTHTGVFQVLSKEENAYASLWDLWMPHFVGIYAAGPGFYNGFHGLPTLSNGRRLWEGLLGSPASYGCIILGLEEAETLFQWVELGVPVVVE